MHTLHGALIHAGDAQALLALALLASLGLSACARESDEAAHPAVEAAAHARVWDLDAGSGANMAIAFRTLDGRGHVACAEHRALSRGLDDEDTGDD